MKLCAFYASLTVHLSIIFVNKPTWRTNFSRMFISILGMFRATICPSSGELTVSVWYLVYVTLCGRPSATVPFADDGHMVARNMSKIKTNTHEKFVRQFGLFTKNFSVFVIMLLANSVSVNTEIVRGHRPELKWTEVSVS